MEQKYNNNKYIKLSPELEKAVLDIFNSIDKDGGGTIDKAETLKHWYYNIINNNNNTFI